MNSNGQVTQLGEQYIGEISSDQDSGGQAPLVVGSAPRFLVSETISQALIAVQLLAIVFMML